MATLDLSTAMTVQIEDNSVDDVELEGSTDDSDRNTLKK